MASERGFLSAFESATGIDVPETICGVDVPDPDLGDIGEVAGNILSGISGQSEVLDKAVAVRELTATGTQKAGNCWGVIDRAGDIMSALKERIEPLEPLFHPVDRAPEAVAMFNKDNLDSVVKIILDVLDLGKLLQKIMDILDGVRSIFSQIAETCGDVFETVKAYMGDLVDDLLSALHLDGALDTVGDFFEGVKSLIFELGDIGGILKPILEAWQESNFLEAATSAFQNFEDVKDALSRFMPSWDTCQRHYESARSYGFNAFEVAQRAFKLVRQVVSKLSQVAGVAIPSGFGARAIDMQPTVAPRGGLPPIEDDVDLEEPACNSGGGAFSQAPVPPEIAQEFIEGLRREYVEGEGAVIGALFGSWDAEYVDALAPHEDAVREAEDQGAAIDELERQWN
eukprot:TRINITY_DN3916_c0_g1_i2.p1 TRINITY_DN3916_c0_g1~~TRINITY_DN3916_c0_g1_i2.p1  ORF type:complete len:399 (-),score=88.02 TRINITY_DN3916_c0_g1_i2:230-1426(-)